MSSKKFDDLENEPTIPGFDAVAWSRQARQSVSKKYRKPDGSWDWEKWENREKRGNDRDEHKK